MDDVDLDELYGDVDTTANVADAALEDGLEDDAALYDDLDDTPQLPSAVDLRAQLTAATAEREDESFVDANKNYVYDAGEQLINDDGDGVYEGPKEGQGNIYFMDTAYGTGGVTNGFMYAENNAYVAPAVVSSAFSKPADYIYGVKGFLSAGGIFSLADRSNGSKYINYKVTYDDRIENGTFNFKGKPNSSGSYKGLKVRTWRVISATP